MTDAEMVLRACGRAYNAIQAELDKRDAAPWWRKLFQSDHAAAALIGGMVAVGALAEELSKEIADGMPR